MKDGKDADDAIEDLGLLDPDEGKEKEAPRRKADEEDKEGSGSDFDIDDVIKEAMAEDKKDEGIQRVSDLIEGDFELVSEEETMTEKDIAIQNYIMDLEADLAEKMRMIAAEKENRETLEKELETLRGGAKDTGKEAVTLSVQGYLSDLESDLERKVEELDREKEEKERLEGELDGLRESIKKASMAEEEMSSLRKELEMTRSASEVEVARLEEEQRRKAEETSKLSDRIMVLEKELERRGGVVDSLHSKISESEAALIDFKQRVNALESQVDVERRKGEEARSRAQELRERLDNFKETLSKKDDEAKRLVRTTRSLDEIKEQLGETSSRLDLERSERERAEKEVGRLRSELEKVGSDMKGDIRVIREEKERTVQELEEERGRRERLEAEIRELKSSIAEADGRTRDELEALRREHERLQVESREKERSLQTEIFRLNAEKEDVVHQMTNLEREKAEVEAMRKETEEEYRARSQDISRTDSRLRSEFERLKEEKEALEEKNNAIVEKERRMQERERALREKETRLRGELRAIALGLPRPEEAPVSAGADADEVVAAMSAPPEGQAARIREVEEVVSSSRTEEILRRLKGKSDERAKEQERVEAEVKAIASASLGREDEGRRLDRDKDRDRNRDRDEGPADARRLIEASVEAKAAERPKIWPPLGSMRMAREMEEAREVPPPPRGVRADTGGLREDEAVKEEKEKEKDTRSVLHWPDSAYEAEARRTNRPFVPGAHGHDGPEERSRAYIIDRYISAKGSKGGVDTREAAHRGNGHVKGKGAPEGGRMWRCMCGTEVLLTEAGRKKGLICPGCGRRIF